jgi:serine phosphatase RsbU (regulator of sigma subunit)/anti-sigma regulatory factor (Ser/Thr protein kinase)/transcriptional regulator with GAF, ATPase, and Fis domain
VTLEDQTPRQAGRPTSRSPLARYLFAVVASVLAVAATTAIYETVVGDAPVYALLIATVALSTWYGGFGPAVAAIAICWFGALWLLIEPRGGFGFQDTEDTTRWWINLVVAVFVAGSGGLLRARERRSAGEALSAREVIRDIESLQQLTIALTSAASSADVALAVVAHAPGIVSADGVAVAVVDGAELSILDSGGLAHELRRGQSRVPLGSSTPFAVAARVDSAQTARGSNALAAVYGHGLQELSAPLGSVVAVPLHARGDVVGSVELLFTDEDAPGDETYGLARIVADLAGQALERARLYERELESRRALERILLVAPRFLADESEDVTTTICREARTTFGADYGVLWRIRDETLELVSVDPPRHDLAGARLPLGDFPRLRAAIQGFGTSFVPDVHESTSGAGLDFVRSLGIRSSLRTPMVVSGTSELVLSISWQTIVSEPDAATIAVVRRFADQARLVLEQFERRRAQEDAMALADASRRLNDVTSALSQAATTLDVSNVCLEHALKAIGAEAGFVVMRRAEGVEVDVVTSTGYDDEELEAWRRATLEDDVPFARVIASDEGVWALTPDELAAFTGLAESRSKAWISLPLTTRRGTSGALHLSLRRPVELTEADRDWLRSMVFQCGQALERSGLYEEEQRSRLRAERLQGITTLLSNAVTPAEVAAVVAEEVASAVEADAVTVTAVSDGALAAPLASLGDETTTSALVEPATTSETPATRALRRRRSLVLEEYDGSDGTALLVPLVAGGRPNGLLVATWSASRRLSAEDRTIVEALAGQAALAIDRAQQYELEQTIAETLQRSVLPVSLPRVGGVEMAARYLPGSAQLDVGGDWFDAFRLSDERIGLVVGDVVGKGVQAAATMAQLRNAIRAFSVERLKPSSMLARLNLLANDVLETSFATVVYLVLDPVSGLCRLSSAGHPPPLVIHADGRVEYLEGVGGIPLGTGVDTTYRQEVVQLSAGSLVLLYTDGLVERRGTSIDDGLERLRQAVMEGPRDPDRLLDHVLDRVVGQEERGDDIALLAARALPVAPRPLELRVRADMASMEVVRDVMRAWLAGLTVDRKDVEDVVLATWETCANAIEHAVDPTSSLVSVDASTENGRIRVVVRDTGGWAPPSARADRGLGLLLVEALVTSFEVTRSGDGTTVTLDKTVGTPPTS